MQHLAQVRLRLLLGGVRPGQERQVRPGLRRGAVQQQVGEQRLGPGGVKRGDLLLPEPQVETAEPGTPSADALNLLASWAATTDRAETRTAPGSA
jgi:hypothetical protein